MAKLYELHRSTLYEAVSKGRVSAGFDGKGQRVIDLAEMIRVYGEPPGNPTLSPDTSTPTPDSYPTPAIWAEMLAELRLLREEVAGLRQEMRLIEHKPGDVLKNEESQPAMQGGMPEKPQSFADLLAGLK